MTDIYVSARRGAGAPAEILYGTVTFKPTLAHSRSTSIVLPSPTTYDLVSGQVVATNVQPTPEPVEGQIEWAYEVTFKDRHSKAYSFIVGVPDSTAQVNFTSLPRYFETKPPLFGQGPKGEPGEAATVAVGTVTGGSTAQVTNTGTNQAAVLNFVLPKGDKGDTGPGVPAGGTALQYIRKNAGNTATEWVSASGALASASSAGFMSAPDKALLDTATELANPNSIVRRSSSGRVFYPDPALSQNPVTLGYLENALTPFVLKDTLVWNVLDHGAKGDGVTDDTEAVRAVMASSPQGSIIYFPNTGQPYRLGKLFAKEGTYLKFAPGTVVKRKGVTFGVINTNLDNSSPLKNTSDPYSGHGNITIDGGIWDGNISEEFYFPSGYNCHHFIAAKNITLKNVEVRDVVTNHAVDINGIKNFRVENCRFLGYKDATTEQNRQYTEAIQYGPVSEEPSGSWPWVVYANGSPSRGITVTGSVFGASGTSGTTAWPTGFGNHSALWAESVQLTGNITLSENEFHDCPFSAVTIYSYSNVKVDNNYFYSCAAGVKANNFTNSKKWDKTASQWVSAPSRVKCLDQSYTNNTFTDTAEIDISVLGTGVSSVDGAWDTIESILIENNTRVRTLAGRSSQQFIRVIIAKTVKVIDNIGGYSTSGIDIGTCEDVLVRGNTITNTLGYGIIVSNASNPGQGGLSPAEAKVVGNEIISAGSHGIGVNGILGFSIQGNRVLNNARVSSGAGILFSGSDKGLVSGNSVECKTLPYAVNGIQGSNSTNTNITYDNKIDGVTANITSIIGAGTSYGNIVYT